MIMNNLTSPPENSNRIIPDPTTSVFKQLYDYVDAYYDRHRTP